MLSMKLIHVYKVKGHKYSEIDNRIIFILFMCGEQESKSSYLFSY